MTRFRIKKVAVLGAGVMGAQIAAHCANAGVPVVLFDLAGKDRPDGIVAKALEGLKKLEPAPLAARDRLAHIEAANYDQHLHRLADCDLIIEAIAERLDWKADLYRRIAPHVAPHAILASNTSGLSIASLADALPEALRSRFCGIHFFNPPRYMPLVELIGAAATPAGLLDDLETWLVTGLGKGVVRAKDTPNFIANRVGVFALIAALHHAGRLGLAADEVDALTGPLIGRPKSATYRTADVVGLDTLAHVVGTMREHLAGDPWHAHYRLPEWLSGLIARGDLGQKTGAGVYRKVGREIQVLDGGAYRPAAGQVADQVAQIMKLPDAAARFAALRASDHPQARFLWAIHRDVFHYGAVHLAAIAENARDVDLALRWGFGWSAGPFETWQGAGWRAIAEAVQADIAAGDAMAAVPLPAWVGEVDGVHGPQGSYSAALGTWQGRSALPVYRRQRFPEVVLGEPAIFPETAGETLWRNGAVRLWRLPEADAGIGILSLTTKMHALGREAIAGIREAVAQAESHCDGLVLWQEAPFAVGADLKELAAALEAGDIAGLERFVGEFQQAMLAVKYAQVPVVAAVSGLALGGGCELALHCHRRVVALETSLGLVEAGVGLIPAGGGCKELALRAARLAAKGAGGYLPDFIAPAFDAVAKATVSGSALHARELGFLDDADLVVAHPRELLHVALAQARALAEAGHRPPLPARQVPVAGRTGIASLEMGLANLKEGGFISAHDHRVARAAAVALGGGEVAAGSRVDEDWLLAAERRLFVELVQTEATRARIAQMLATGKSLRN